MKYILLFALVLLFSDLSFGQITLKINPAKVYIEHDQHQQLINADLIIQNSSPDTVSITKIGIRVFDQNKKLVLEKFVDGNGTSPSIQTIPKREIIPGESQLLFNPFFSFSKETPLTMVQFTVITESNTGKETSLISEINPIKTLDQKPFSLPLKVKFLIYDGHDHLSHHRRFDYNLQGIKAFGFEGNFMRYAYDFCPVTEDGKMISDPDDAKIMSNWIGFGKTVYAAAPGKVIALIDSCADDRSFNPMDLMKDPLALYGNYVVIEHADGNVSMYGHLKNKSTLVKIGQSVKEGQQIARIGASGSSLMPHLHFELRTGIDKKAEGLPSYFKNFYRFYGSGNETIKSGRMDTGEIIQSKQ